MYIILEKLKTVPSILYIIYNIILFLHHFTMVHNMNNMGIVNCECGCTHAYLLFCAGYNIVCRTAVLCILHVYLPEGTDYSMN